MCKCKLSDVPVNRLTTAQCDKIIERCNIFSKLMYHRAQFDKMNRWEDIGRRIQQYRDNLIKRNLP